MSSDAEVKSCVPHWLAAAVLLDATPRYSESVETMQPSDAWAFLRCANVWKRIIHEDKAATASARTIAAADAKAASVSSPVSCASSSASIPAGALHRPLLRLADVELQVVMTFLPCRDLVHFARLCHRTVHAASSALPWRAYVVPVRVNEPPSHIQGLHARPGFLAYAPVSLTWRCYHPREPWFHAKNARYLNAALNHLTARPVHRLEVSYPPPVDSAVLCRFAEHIFSHVSLKPLRIVKLGRGGWRVGNPGVMRALSALPHLHSIDAAPDCHSSLQGLHTLRSCKHDNFDPTAEAAEAWVQLTTIPNLTALNLADTGKLANKSRLPHVFACSKLERLGVVWPSLYGPRWAAFFSAPAIQQLQSLSLDFFDASSTRPGLTEAQRIPEGAFAAGWASMLRLRTLTLRHIRGIDQLLPSIAAAPALESLVLFPGVRSSELNVLDTVPRPSILASLINCAPNLVVKMIVLTSQRKSAVKIGLVLAYESSVLSLTLQRFSLDLVADSKAVRCAPQ